MRALVVAHVVVVALALDTLLVTVMRSAITAMEFAQQSAAGVSPMSAELIRFLLLPLLPSLLIGVVLLLRCGKTTHGKALEAKQALSFAGANIIGAILNQKNVR